MFARARTATAKKAANDAGTEAKIMVSAHPVEHGYAALATWWARVETPDALAARWIALVERLQETDPKLAEWYEWQNRDPVAFDPDRARVRRLIEAGVLGDDDDPTDPFFGYLCRANSTAEPTSPQRLSIDMLAGGASSTSTNFAGINTDYNFDADPAVVTYTIFRSAVLALGESFEATSAMAYPTRISDLWPKERVRCPALDLAWISYVGPQYAHLVKPPPTAIVEHRPDGGLLMAATDETFVTTNPAHLAVARDIDAALASFNAQMVAESDARLTEGRRAGAEAASRRSAAERSNSR